MNRSTLPPITIVGVTRVERKQLLNVRFGMLSKRGIPSKEIIETLVQEFGISKSVVYSLIDTRLV